MASLHPSHGYGVFLQLLVIAGRESVATQTHGHQNVRLSRFTFHVPEFSSGMIAVNSK